MHETVTAASRRRLAETLLTHGGRDPAAHWGFVNTPVVRGSTVAFRTLAELDDFTIRHRYGRQGTPTTDGVADLVTALEGAEGTVLAPSGLAAIAVALLGCLNAGDEVLVTDSAYEPTRLFCTKVLAPLGIATRYIDPRIGADIAGLLSERTRAVFLESPGSLTFELNDIPAIAGALAGRGVTLICDNSWATPLFCQPLVLGCDVVVHAATKMFVGHSDVMFGTVSGRGEIWPRIADKHRSLGMAVSPDDAYLVARGLRTLAVRMPEHERRALALARFLAARDDVVRVLHPALPDHPDHALFQRDFGGSGSLFSFLLPPGPRSAIAAMVDHMELFAMGYSWGGYESLILPVTPARARSAVPWVEPGNLMRLHVGFEAIEDLERDLATGLERYRAAL